MKNNIRKSSGINSGQSEKINMSRDEIKRTLPKQDEDIERSNVDLILQTRQIGFTAERNTYRRNMIVAL